MVKFKKLVKNVKIAKADKSTKTKSNSGNTQALPFNTDRGQHILKNPGIVNSIIQKSAIKATDTVLEVGPGTGNLTVKILEKAKKVIACEIDQRMIAELKKRTIGTPFQNKLEIQPGDVCRQEWPFFDICVANLPYQISSVFVNKLLLHRPQPRYAVLMFQKEFADRLTAKPGDKHYCRLSATVQLLAKGWYFPDNVEHLLNVKRTEFRPPPNVDSAVVRIAPKCPPPPINYEEWDGMLRLCFHRKNRKLVVNFTKKNVVNLLKSNYIKVCKLQNRPLPADDDDFKEYIKKVMEESDFASKRCRRLTIEDFLTLLLVFNTAGIHFRS